MSELKRIRRCYGCGVILQSLDEKLPGFVPEVQLVKHEIVLCQRCFRLQHYGKDDHQGEPSINEEFFHILDAARNENALIVYVFDLFSFESSFVSAINERIKGLTTLVVANKRDLLPREVSDQKLREYVLSRAKEAGMVLSDIVITSSIKNYNMDELKEKISTIREGRNVYFIGAASSGKSSIINNFIKNYSNTTSMLITTSPFPGTTLRVIEIPLDEASFLFDTPGISVDNSLIFKVEKEVLKVITPQKEVKPRTFQLNDGQSLILGGLARLDFVKGPRTGFSVYLANPVDINRAKLERADRTMESLIKNKGVKPISKIVQSVKDLEAFEITVTEKNRLDVGITGLGWIAFKGNGQVLRVMIPKGVKAYVRMAKI
jgi:30S ribosome assembly GTPase